MNEQKQTKRTEWDIWRLYHDGSSHRHLSGFKDLNIAKDVKANVERMCGCQCRLIRREITETPEEV